MGHTLLQSVPYLSAVNPIILGLIAVSLLAYLMWYAWTLWRYRPEQPELWLRLDQGRGGAAVATRRRSRRR